MKKLSIVFVFFSTACADHEFPPFIDCETTSLSFQIHSIVPATDCDTADGSVTFNAKGGRKPYAFSTNGVTWSEDSSFQALASNAYSFFLKDANGCIHRIDSTVTSSSPFPFPMVISSDSKCIENDGAVLVQVGGDANGFQFRIDQGMFSNDPLFEGLQDGDHTLYIRSGDGCITTTAVNVPRVPTDLSWMNDILPIMTSSCASAGCHDGLSRADWRDYSQVKLYAQAIKRRTRDRSMPFDKTLPQDQIDKISCWVDDGALNN